MPSRPDPTRGEAVRVVMTDLVLGHGILGLSIRRVASGVGIAPSTLVAQFTHRKRLVTWFSATASRRRQRQMEWRAARDGWVGLLPRDPESLEAESIWSAVSELGRTDDEVGDVVQGRHEELCDLVRALGRGEGRSLDSDDVELVVAGLDGLRRAMVRQLEPMPLDRASRLLDRLVEGVVEQDRQEGYVRPSS
ncbi:hypothetical protein [Nocardioides daphniae]|uniref:TetR family transcriptional regulator n=1 Tax=Nocardioides daphniae TaxID=402297 RepID=A0A4V1CW65_9ACTN|nr:hypothetical protein [Nocardioides daphniae]QCC76187.1 hypothetical protein E2C04_01370 [Nocardioides daphniae]GGD09218.1 hypothetical protein GCM10007231_05120 [Nocardioides daphniae]